MRRGVLMRLAAIFIVTMVAGAYVWAQGNLASVVAQQVPRCQACHGQGSRVPIAGVPWLAAQPKVFLENRMVLIREGLSPVESMKGLLDGLKDDELVALATYFSALPVPEPAGKRDSAMAERGKFITERALCGSCHLPSQAGREQMPRLATQREDYLLLTMRNMLVGKAAGRDTLMTNALGGMKDSDLQDIAHHLATMPAR